MRILRVQYKEPEEVGYMEQYAEDFFLRKGRHISKAIKELEWKFPKAKVRLVYRHKDLKFEE